MILPLMPMQSRFFSVDRNNPHHWNLAYSISVSDSLNEKVFKQSVKHVFVRHEGLRVRFIKESDEWKQSVADLSDIDFYKYVNLSEIPSDLRRERLDAEIDHLQSTLRLNGTLGKIVYYEMGNGFDNLVFLLFHHAIIDSFSISILARELHGIYSCLLTGKSLDLPQVEDSVSKWAKSLKEYANSYDVISQLDYWKHLPWDEVLPLPTDYNSVYRYRNDEKVIHSAKLILRKGEINRIEKISRKFYKGISKADLFLAVVCNALHSWTDRKVIQVGIVKAGRDDMFGGLDGTNTVGCFVRHCPFVADFNELSNIEDKIPSIIKQIKNIPIGGASFGLLQHLCDDDIASCLRETPEIEVEYNYMDQSVVELTKKNSETWESKGLFSFSNDAKNKEILLQNWRVIDRKSEIEFNLSCSGAVYSKKTVNTIAKYLSDAVHSLLNSDELALI